MHLVKSSGNKLLSILRLIPTPNAVTNQTDSLSMGPNNANISGNGGENMVAIDFAIRNEEIGELNRDAKVGLKIQPNTTTMAPISYWPTTTIGTLVPVSSVPVSVCCSLAPVYNGRPPLSWVQLPSCISHAKSMALFIKLFENTQDVSMYKRFLAMDNSNDN